LESWRAPLFSVRVAHSKLIKPCELLLRQKEYALN